MAGDWTDEQNDAIAAAPYAGCDRLRSEDMQYGTVLGEGLRIVDPFCAAG